MVIQLTPQSQPQPSVELVSDDSRACKQVTVFSIFAAIRAPDGIKYSKPGYYAQRSGFPEFRGYPDLWDGGDAA
jgi:hypothetical protein